MKNTFGFIGTGNMGGALAKGAAKTMAGGSVFLSEAGKTAVAANEILANFGLNIRIAGTNNYMSGSGAVAIAQSHAPGSEVERGTVITVTFRNQDADDIAQE